MGISTGWKCLTFTFPVVIIKNIYYKSGDIMKKQLQTVLFLLIITFISACKTTEPPKAGTLPKKWWTMDAGAVTNYYAGEAKGLEKEIIIFIGKDESVLNVDETTAINNARMDAMNQLSTYLSSKFTRIQQNSKHIDIINTAVVNGDMSNEKGSELIKKINDTMSAFSASVTSTQFSSFRQEATHVEDDKGKMTGWVCFSMSNQVLEEVRKQQTEAFKTLMAETEEYKEIMSEIQEIIAEQVKDSIMNMNN